MITLFEAYNTLTFDEKYKSIIRKCLNDIIKPNIDKLDNITDRILKLIATNRTLKYEIRKNISLDDKNFEKNAIYILDNIKKFFDIVFKTYLNGQIGELIVKDLLETGYKVEVRNPSDQQDKNGIDFITHNHVKHQVKFIHDYIQDKLNFKIINKFLDIKKTDMYDYIWFFVDEKNEVVHFKKTDNIIEEIEKSVVVDPRESPRIGYSIKYIGPDLDYTIKKDIISEVTIKNIKDKINKIKLNFDENIEVNSKKLSIVRKKLELLNNVKKYNV